MFKKDIKGDMQHPKSYGTHSFYGQINFPSFMNHTAWCLPCSDENMVKSQLPTLGDQHY